MVEVNKHPEKMPRAPQPTNLGPRLRAVRKERSLTLDQLSRMADVSKAMLSQIEQSKVNPTVAVMLKIARALRVSISELLDVPEKQNILRLIRADDELYTFRSDPLCNIRTLSPLSLEKTIEFYLVTLESSGELASESHFPGTEEIVYVARGRLEVTSGGQIYDLKKGDSIHYRADAPHALKNLSRNRAEAYMIVRYRED